MVTIAKIKEIRSTNEVMVTIPAFDGNENFTGFNPNYTSAEVCVPYGNYPQFNIDDEVIIAFLNGWADKPVVIGQLFNTGKSYQVEEVLNSLNVKLNANLPFNTTIGDVSALNILHLKNSKSNIQQQLDNIVQRLNNIENKNDVTIDLSIENFEGAYDGNLHTFGATSSNGTLTYSIDNEQSFISTKPKFRDVGTYSIIVKATLTGYPATYIEKMATVTITKQSVQEIIKWENTDSVYDTEEHSIKVSTSRSMGAL